MLFISRAVCCILCNYVYNSGIYTAPAVPAKAKQKQKIRGNENCIDRIVRYVIILIGIVNIMGLVHVRCARTQPIVVFDQKL